MLMKKVYVSYDGKQFDTAQECTYYEKHIAETFITTLEDIQSFCNSTSCCAACPFNVNGCFFIEGVNPKHWEFKRLKEEFNV